MYCDTPEEQILVSLFGDNRTEMDVEMVGLQNGELIFGIWVVEKPGPNLVRK